MNSENPIQFELKRQICEMVQDLLLTRKYQSEKQALEFLWKRARHYKQPLPFKSKTFVRFYGSYRYFKNMRLKVRLEN